MYCKYLKLTNGEDLIVRTENNCTNLKKDKLLTVIDPVLINSIRIGRGSTIIETYTMTPWIKMAKEGIINIPAEAIITAVDVVEEAEQQYSDFITEYNKEDRLKRISPPTEEEIENMMNDMFESDEEEEYDPRINEPEHYLH